MFILLQYLSQNKVRDFISKENLGKYLNNCSKEKGKEILWVVYM